MILTEKGTLPRGVEYEGKNHREFEIREQLVKDSLAVFEEKETSQRALSSDPFYNIAIMAQRITKLGDIPKEAITPNLVQEMHQVDYSEIMASDRRLAEKRSTFQEKND